MTILHRYILRHLIGAIGLALLAFTFLFLVVDFFDRIDNIVAEDAGFWISVQYFLLKIPLTVSRMLPIATLIGTMFAIGMLSKNAEITAMRASGASVLWLARPLFATGLVVSLVTLLLNETIVPVASRRVREIYNIDIRQKDKRGGYSQNNFWWRVKDTFYSIGVFDSRSNSMVDFSSFNLSPEFAILRRTNAESVSWIDPLLGWSMEQVIDYRFRPGEAPDTVNYPKLPLPITSQPEDFYDVKTDPNAMSYRQLRRYIKDQRGNGIATAGYRTYLYNKIAAPFICFVVTLIALPFALKPARSGSLAASFLAGLIIGFSYFAVDSLSLAMGEAELWPALLAGPMASFVMLTVGGFLCLGVERPS